MLGTCGKLQKYIVVPGLVGRGQNIGGAQELKILMKGVESVSCVFTGGLQEIHCHESAWQRPSKHNRLCYS